MDLKVFCAKCGREVRESTLMLVNDTWCCRYCAKVAQQEMVTAQHDETGRMWSGPLADLPPRYFVIPKAGA